MIWTKTTYVPVRIRRGKWMVAIRYDQRDHLGNAQTVYNCDVVPYTETDENGIDHDWGTICGRPGESARDVCLRALETPGPWWFDSEAHARYECEFRNECVEEYNAEYLERFGSNA